MPIMWPLDETVLPSSTQDQAVERILTTGTRQPFGLYGGQQRHGRGSHGRRWLSAPDHLALTCAWPLSAGLAGPGAAVAWPVYMSVLVVRALEARLGPLPQCQLKWPNDLLLGGKKVAGLLVECRQIQQAWWLLIGVGLNGRWGDALPADFSAAELFTEAHHGLVATDLARPIAETLWGWLAEFESMEAKTRSLALQALRQAFHGRDALRNQPVVLTLATGQQSEAVAQGLADDGGLRVVCGQQALVIRIGEVRVRPALPLGFGA